MIFWSTAPRDQHQPWVTDINESSIWEMVLRAAASSVTKKAAARGKLGRSERADTDTASVASSRSAASSRARASALLSSASSQSSTSRASSLTASLAASWSSLTRSKGKAAPRSRGPALDRGPRPRQQLADLPEDAQGGSADLPEVAPGAAVMGESNALAAAAGHARAPRDDEAAEAGAGVAADEAGAARAGAVPAPDSNDSRQQGSTDARAQAGAGGSSQRASPSSGSRASRTAALGAPVFSRNKAAGGPWAPARRSVSAAASEASAASAGRSPEAPSRVNSSIFGNSTELSQPRTLDSAAVAPDASSDDDWGDESPRAFESTLVATPRSVRSVKSVSSASRVQQLPDMRGGGDDLRCRGERREGGKGKRAGEAREVLRQSRESFEHAHRTVVPNMARAAAAGIEARRQAEAVEIEEVGGGEGAAATMESGGGDGGDGPRYRDAHQHASRDVQGGGAAAASLGEDAGAGAACAQSEAGFSILDEVRTQYTESEAESAREEDVDSSVDESDNDRVEAERRQFFREAYCLRGSDSEDDLADLDQALEARDAFEARCSQLLCEGGREEGREGGGREEGGTEKGEGEIRDVFEAGYSPAIASRRLGGCTAGAHLLTSQCIPCVCCVFVSCVYTCVSVSVFVCMCVYVCVCVVVVAKGGYTPGGACLDRDPPPDSHSLTHPGGASGLCVLWHSR
jgi:hypothetical protein